MKEGQTAPENIDDYIANFPPDVQELLQKVRATIREAAPDAEETIKYQMPTFVLKGNLVYFGGFKMHVGFYPVPTGIEAFAEELAPYKTGKGSIQFPFDKPIPYDLITKVVKFRVQENLKKAEEKRKRKRKD